MNEPAPRKPASDRPTVKPRTTNDLTAPPAPSGVAAHGSLGEALAAFQAEVPKIEKGREAKVTPKDNPGAKYSYAYADLSDILPAVLPVLARHGLAWTSKPTSMGEMGFVLHYKLVWGEETDEGVYPLPDPLRSSAQALGSAITYARRYCFNAQTGVAPVGEDDDGAAATQAANTSAAKAKPKKPEPEGPIIATVDWAVPIANASTESQLRGVWNAANDAGELGYVFQPGDRAVVVKVAEKWGLPIPPESVRVADLLNAVRGVMVEGPAVLPPSAEPEDAVTEWPTATPGALAGDEDV